ncbi:MAG: P-loop NTPase [Desulfurococcaceae archaeon]
MIRDPRILRARKIFSKLKKVYCVLSTKGGVGKTTISALLALYSSRKGIRTGLLDLDFVNPSTHVFLGVYPWSIKYREELGVYPYRLLDNLWYFTTIAFTSDNPMALRGKSSENALWEVLSIVNWDNVEVLFIDTPPGISDEHLELLGNLIEYIEPIIISTPSRLSLNTTTKYIKLLRAIGYSKVYLFENMGSGELITYAGSEELIYLGNLPYLSDIEDAIGNIDKLLGLGLERHILIALNRLGIL